MIMLLLSFSCSLFGGCQSGSYDSHIFDLAQVFMQDALPDKIRPFHPLALRVNP